jgi:hypothetical protein
MGKPVQARRRWLVSCDRRRRLRARAPLHRCLRAGRFAPLFRQAFTVVRSISLLSRRRIRLPMPPMWPSRALPMSLSFLSATMATSMTRTISRARPLAGCATERRSQAPPVSPTHDRSCMAVMSELGVLGDSQRRAAVAVCDLYPGQGREQDHCDQGDRPQERPLRLAARRRRCADRRDAPNPTARRVRRPDQTPSVGDSRDCLARIRVDSASG